MANREPTRFTRGRELRAMLSKFRGKCSECRKPINRGSPIGWSRATGAMHAACCGVEVSATFGAEKLTKAIIGLARENAAVKAAAMVAAEAEYGAEPAYFDSDPGFWERVMAGVAS